MNMKTVRLKSGEHIPLGYYWIYSNQIGDALKNFQPGEPVFVTDYNNFLLGTGYINPHSLIAVRLLSDTRATIDADFFSQKILAADNRRRQWLPETSCYRLLYGESDGLPGLVIDRYDDAFVLQSFTAGMDRFLETITDVLISLYHPQVIIFRNDLNVRQLERIESYKKVVYGNLPDEIHVMINGIRYQVDLMEGQKTGFFLDQRENHRAVRHYAKEKRVLDCFSYVGAWGLNAAFAGAAEITGLDISDKAVALSQANAIRNGLPQCHFRTANVFEALKSYNERKEIFDLIILDPPAFAKSRAETRDAVKGYREINRRAAKALNDGGILVTCSCSYHIDRDTFRNTVQQGLASAGREAVILEQRGQAQDHPILMSMRETEYLKCLILQVI